MIYDYFNLTLRNLSHRRLRSYLTIIGIIIGIASIIALISISQGLENAITEQFEKIGSNRIFVVPKGFTGVGNLPGITTEDLDQLKKMPEIAWTNPYLIQSDEVEFSRTKRFVQQIVAIETEDVAKKYSDMDIDLEAGRFPNNGEKYVAVVGYKFAHDLFDKDIPLKGKIKLKDKKFTVVGIMEEIGNSDDDNSVWIPMDNARELYNKPKEITAIELKIKKGLDLNEVADKIFKRLKRARNNENFEVSTPEQILSQINELLAVIQLVLGGIAAISLIVGGVGIMNTMYTSVLERTKEIGIMKSIGATNNIILLIFIIESGFIGLIGGSLGVILGNIIAFLVGVIAKNMGFGLLKIVFDYKLSLFSLSFAFFIGMLAGFLPARRASKLKPAEALRA
jgi:putative ABC transport system permease protein